MKRTIIIDGYECNGCGSCVEICPEVFVLEEGEDVPSLRDPNAEITDKVEEAAAYCPQKCISFN